MFRNITGRNRNRNLTRGEQGFTLSEVLVSIAVFAVVSAIAMTLYARLQKTFKQGENAASQQQNTRIAFDRMIADLRMAGFNYNPDGDTSRPDEQIEGMWQHAVTVRGDFDFETSDSTTPESTLGGASMTFGTISTGNDEIVTYALRKPNGTGGQTLQFQADVSEVPRDGTLETIPLNNVYLDMNSPPYTLYRITLKPGGTALSSMADYQPVADNIKSVEFTYYKGDGSVITTYAGGMDTGNLVGDREKIARIGVNIVGMTQDPDRDYTDPTDTDPDSEHYRKFELSGDVIPRNLGFVGMPDLDLDDPTTPTGLSVCSGHCEGLWVKWNANNAAEGVVKYALTYGPAVISQGTPQDIYSTSTYLNGLGTSGSYVVGLRAVDSGNNQSPAAYSSSTAMSNTTTPDAPGSVTASSISGGDALPNQIALSLARPTHNEDPNSTLGCDLDPADPNKTALRDLAGYRLYRGASASFDPNVPAQVQSQWDPNTLPGTAATPSVTDPSVVNCRTYYYKALAEDLCGIQSTIVAGNGAAETTDLPSAPLNVVATDMGLNQSLITWDPVTTDVNSATILIDSYDLYVATVPTGNDPNLATYSMVSGGAVSNPASPAMSDPNAPTPPAGSDIYYRVKARDDCPNESADSTPALLTSCSFGGSLNMTMTPGGSLVSGIQAIGVTVSGTTTVGAVLSIRDAGTGVPIHTASSATYPYAFTWDTAATGTPGQTYIVAVAVTNSSGCIEVVTQTVVVGGSFGCGAITPTAASVYNIGGNPKNNIARFDLQNTGAAAIAITQVRVEWEDNGCGSPVGVQLRGLRMDVTDPNFIYALSPPTNGWKSGTPPLSVFDLRNTPFKPLPLSVGATSTLEFDFTKAMAFTCGGGPSAPTVANTIFATFDYDVLPGLGGGQCLIIFQPDLTAPGLNLCDATDPNCPAFF